jgi:TonB family protein
MQNRRLVRGLVVAVASAFLAGSAFADIAAFNAAVKAGDYKTAAAEAKAIWPTWDKTDRDTAVLAREFGFASYVSGNYADAKIYGQFLKEQGATLPVPDDQPATSRVLLAAANFRLKSDGGTRNDLLEALKGREAAAGIDNVSVLAAEALYKSDWSSGDWPGANETAGIAWRLLGRAGPALSHRALDARAIFASAGFLGGPDKDDYDNIVDAHDAVVAEINTAMDPRKRLAFAPLKYLLEAWSLSVQAYFRAGQQTGSNIPIRVKERELAEVEGAMFPESVMTGDQCAKPIVEWPKIQYPAAAEYGGMVGTVIIKIDTNASGRVTDFETLAAVPARHFANAVEKAMPALVYKRSPTDAPNCNLAAKSRLVRISFRML